MNIWAAEYCFCTYEGDYGILALYASKPDAEKHVEKHKKKVSKTYRDGIAPAWMKWRVKKRYVRFSEPRRA